MKVYEKLNELKHCNCSIETIANWFYNGRVYPMDIINENALELDIELPYNLKKVLEKYDGKVLMNGYDSLKEMLNVELIEDKEMNKKC